MLKVIRDNLKYLSWILWVIIALFVAAIFIGFGDVTSSFDKGAGSRSVAATVGHDTITREDYQRSYQALEQRYQQRYGDQFTTEMAKQMQVPLQALTQAVNQRLMLSEADRLGLKVSDEEVRQRILTAPIFQEDGHFVGESLYRQFLQDQLKMTAEQFERQMREDLVLGKLIETLQAGVFISDDEVAKAYRDQNEKAKVRYLELPRGRFVQAQEPTPAELSSYYEAHKAEYKLPEQRDVSYILVEKAKLLPQIQIDDAAMKAYYDAHAKEFGREEQVHARHILAKVDDQHSDAAAQARIADAKRRIEKGEDFAKVAKELSDDPGSKDRGGDLGFFGRKTMAKDFEDAAFGAEPNKLVGPIHSNFGYHLIEVLAKQPGGQQPFEQVKQQIGTRLALERSQDVAQTKAKQLADRLSREKPKDGAALETIAKTDPIFTYARTGLFSEKEPVAGIGQLPAFNKAAFEMSKGAVSQPVQVGRGYAILLLTDVQAPKTPTLAEVDPKVRLAVGTQKQQQMALDQLSQAKDQIAKGGKTLDQVASELGLQAKDSQEFGGNGFIPGLGFSPQLAQSALTLPIGQVGGPIAAGQGAVLFQVTEHKGGDDKDAAAKKAQIREQLSSERFQKVLGAVIEKRKRDLGVNFNRQFLEAMDIQPQQAS
jgi:peptidyl-prolyl cis-trans isomerase D